jgi:predicted Zn-ribbon and HTH transcriptional regulator
MIKYHIKKNSPDYDSDDVIFTNDQDEVIGFGFRGKTDKTICITRCPECRSENYAIAVVSGRCAWCGYQVENSNES